MMTEERRAGLLLIAPLALVLAAIFIAPLMLMAPMSVREYTPGQGIGGRWTLENYVRIFTDTYYAEVVWRTLKLGLIVVALCLALGLPLATVIARSTSRYRIVLVLLVIFPLMLNLVVRSFGWIALLANRGIINTWLMDLGLIDAPIKLMFNFTGLVIALTHIYLPFMVLMLVAAIQAIPRDLEAAAAVLGASRTRTFLTVTLPLAAPGVVAGSILVFVLAISALVTPRLLGGPTYKVMATLIYDEFLQVLDWPSGSALAFVLTFIALTVLWLSGLAAKRLAGMGAPP